MNIQEIRNQKQKQVDALLKECGVFFAFSTEQFHQNKTPLKEGEKYVSIGAGGYMPNGSVNKWIEGMAEINKEYKKAIKTTKGAKKDNILYELSNHECYYTGDIQPAIDALGKGYTYNEVYAVYTEKLQSVNQY